MCRAAGLLEQRAVPFLLMAVCVWFTNLLTWPMAFEVIYFHERVLSEIQSWPVDVLADYARLVELLAEHGPTRAQAPQGGAAWLT